MNAIRTILTTCLLVFLGASLAPAQEDIEGS